jgi:ABC-type multidrug transport system fused ATPase/permease subunit
VAYWQALYADPDKLRGASFRVLGRAWRYARSDRYRLAGYISLTVLATLLAVLPPILYQRIVDDALLRPNVGLLLWLILALVGLAVAQAAATMGSATELQISQPRAGARCFNPALSPPLLKCLAH